MLAGTPGGPCDVVGSGLAPSATGASEDEITALVEDLRDDGVRFNATRALFRLQRIGAPAIPALERALDSTDRQQRQMAAGVLQAFAHREWMEVEYEPSDRLLEVSVEGLRRDSLPYGPAPEWEGHPSRTRSMTPVFNAADGTRFLLNHVERAEASLVEALASDDSQQRYFAAVLLGAGGRSAHAAAVAALLLPHLRDNRIPRDAIPATAALYRLGRAVEPHLEAARADADPQQGELIDLILLDLRDPPRTERDLRGRGAMQHITKTVFDPALHGSLERLPAGIPGEEG